MWYEIYIISPLVTLSIIIIISLIKNRLKKIQKKIDFGYKIAEKQIEALTRTSELINDYFLLVFQFSQNSNIALSNNYMNQLKKNLLELKKSVVFLPPSIAEIVENVSKTIKVYLHDADLDEKTRNVIIQDKILPAIENLQWKIAEFIQRHLPYK